MNTLYWITAISFAALLPWGTNVPLQRPGVLVRLMIIANIVFQMVTASFMFEARVSPWASAETRSQTSEASLRYQRYLDFVALTPSKVQDEGSWRWGQLITANFVHSGWLHLAMNLWLFAIFAPNLEQLFGRRRFALFLLGAMLATQLSILYLTEWTNAYRLSHRGFSGVVYAVIGAYLMCFPRSRINVALIYDFKFWAVIAFLLMPFVYILGNRSSSLAELILLLGIIGTFMILHPDHARFGLPAFVLLGYKLLQDAITLPQQMENRVSIWGHLGGLLVGVAAGLLVNGTRGLKQTWEDPDAVPSPRRAEREDKSLAKILAAAKSDEGAARAYLGQRIFVGDAVRAVDFYVHTAMASYPNMELDARELHSLARMLELRAQDIAALHVYEKLARLSPLPAGFEDSLLAAAKLCHKTAPERAADALRYLQRYDEVAPMMRDRMEARRQREEILEAARARGENVDTLFAESGTHPPEKRESGIPSGYGGPGQPERRKTSRTTSRIQQIESSDKYPALKEQDTTGFAPPETIIEEPTASPSGNWGKKRLPLKSVGSDPTVRHGPEATAVGSAHSLHNPPDVPDLPASIENMAGIKRPRVELTGMELSAFIPPEPEDAHQPSIEQLPSKGLDSDNDAITQVPIQQGPAVERQPEAGGVQMTSDDDKHVSVPMLRAETAETQKSGQRESSLKQGAEYASPAFGQGAAGADAASRKMYGDKLATPSPESSKSEEPPEKCVILEKTDNSGMLLPAGEQQSEHMLAVLSQELCRAVTAEDVLLSSGVLKAPNEVDSHRLNTKLLQSGFSAKVIRVPPTVAREPAEVLSLDLHDEDMVCNTVEQGRLRVPLSSVQMIFISSVRLSRRESAPARPLVEIVTGIPVERRLQLHERTFSMYNSKHNGEPLRVDSLQAFAELLSEKISSAKLVQNENDISYQDHDGLVKRSYLTTIA